MKTFNQVVEEFEPKFERATKTDLHYTGRINGKTYVVPHSFQGSGDVLHGTKTTPIRHSIVVSPVHVQHNNPTLTPEEVARVHAHIKDIHGGQEAPAKHDSFGKLDEDLKGEWNLDFSKNRRANMKRTLSRQSLSTNKGKGTKAWKRADKEDRASRPYTVTAGLQEAKANTAPESAYDKLFAARKAATLAFAKAHHITEGRPRPDKNWLNKLFPYDKKNPKGFKEPKKLEEAMLEEGKLFPNLDDSPESHHSRMTHALVRYDRKQEEAAKKNPKRYHNPYAIGHYLKASDDAHQDMKNGATAAQAINNNFNGSLANHLHKHLGTGEKYVETGAWYKTPWKKQTEEVIKEHGYVGFDHKGQRHEVEAPSSYAAQQQIINKVKPPKSKQHLVHVALAELDTPEGRKQYVHTAMEESVKGDVPTHHQTVIAKKTLRMPDAMLGIMGGPSKEEARAHLKKQGWSDQQIHKHETAQFVSESVWHVTDHLGNKHEVEAKSESKAFQHAVSVGGLHPEGVPMTQWNKVKVEKKPLKEERLAKVLKSLHERQLSGAESEKKEEIVHGMKKKIQGFKERYGERAKEVMYATATKQGKRLAEDTEQLNEDKVKTINSHVGMHRWHHEVGEPVGYISAHHMSHVPSPYAYSPSNTVYHHKGKNVVAKETSHKHYEIHEVPVHAEIHASDEEATNEYMKHRHSLPLEESQQLDEMVIGAGSHKVIKAFLNKQSASSKKLSTDGKTLDGNWMGGNRIAHHEGGKVHLNELGSKASQQVHKAIKKHLTYGSGSDVPHYQTELHESKYGYDAAMTSRLPAHLTDDPKGEKKLEQGHLQHCGKCGRVRVFEKGSMNCPVCKTEKVTEEVEQIDELSRDTMLSYVRGAVKNKDFLATKTKNLQARDEKSRKRTKGILRATERLEEAEQIDELSKKTLGSYVKKASTRAADMAYKYGKIEDKFPNIPATKETKLHKGITRALGKLTKEESEQIDEISMGLARKVFNARGDRADEMMRGAVGRGPRYKKAKAIKTANKEYKKANKIGEYIGRKDFKMAHPLGEQLGQLNETFMGTYKRNESMNRHTANIVHLAKHFGTKADQAEAKFYSDELKKHGHQPHHEAAYKLHEKLWPLATAAHTYREEAPATRVLKEFKDFMIEAHMKYAPPFTGPANEFPQGTSHANMFKHHRAQMLHHMTHPNQSDATKKAYSWHVGQMNKHFLKLSPDERAQSHGGMLEEKETK